MFQEGKVRSWEQGKKSQCFIVGSHLEFFNDKELREKSLLSFPRTFRGVVFSIVHPGGGSSVKDTKPKQLTIPLNEYVQMGNGPMALELADHWNTE
ncbi:hypothetical protein ACTXT7_014254 [Hymenolepis weldensis]